MGWTGNDDVYAGDATDLLFGEDNDDNLTGRLGCNDIDAGSGGDTIIKQSNDVVIPPPDGSDTVTNV